ncbi:hypothetical protein OIU84_027625 [Salix udensis]|uniref:EF-hand domain-containing protein n=1 Tax=Salix udensis TaxID=889485 RepID=A0AAD6KHX9_9ROSI|nr:hypothetical protein OIU84_027625 [Salix udensis]
MEEIRRVAEAYYEHLPENDKNLLKNKFNDMDKNKDGQISRREYMKYFKKENAKGLHRQRIFRGLDMDENGRLDFEEAKVLFYIIESGRAIICMSCEKFMAGAYFSCSQCFFSAKKSKFDICCDCYGGKKFKHHHGATFCDNYTLLSQSRSLALEAPAEEIRRVAAAYYKHLPENDKKELKNRFKAMDKNGDKQISLREFMKGKDKGSHHEIIFTALDKDDNGSLDFEEAKVLFYIMESGRAIICMSCEKFMAGAYFSCSQCFIDRAKSNFDICCDCYGGKKFKHHRGATFCDNYTLLSQSRSSALAAPAEERSSALRAIEMIANVTNLAVTAGCIIM